MIPGTSFIIPLSGKHRILTRSSYLRNPLDANAGLEHWHPWIRLYLFLDEKGFIATSEIADFNAVEPLVPLCKILNIPHTAPVMDLAQAILDKFVEVDNEWQARYVRSRLQLVNKVHCDWMGVARGAPNLQMYEDTRIISAFSKVGAKVNVAAHQNGKVLRRGTERYIPTKEGTSEREILHPLAELTAIAQLGNIAELRYDRLESGPWGLRAGILGWNTNAFNIGSILGCIFAANPKLYNDFDTMIYTDRQGRLCNYFGWALTPTEVCTPHLLCRIMELLGHPSYTGSQIAQANRDVNTFLDESHLIYADTHKNHLAALFFVFMYMDAIQWRVLVDVILTKGLDAGIKYGFDALTDFGMSEQVSGVNKYLGFNFPA